MPFWPFSWQNFCIALSKFCFRNCLSQRALPTRTIHINSGFFTVFNLPISACSLSPRHTIFLRGPRTPGPRALAPATPLSRWACWLIVLFGDVSVCYPSSFKPVFCLVLAFYKYCNWWLSFCLVLLEFWLPSPPRHRLCDQLGLFVIRFVCLCTWLLQK